MRARLSGAILAISLLAISGGAVRAACPLELSTYADAESSAEINFAPSGDAATVINRFRLLVANNLILDGIVQWSETVKRPYGMLTYKCPDGDVTGQEMAACTVWQGVIYTADAEGNIGLLPAEDNDAPQTLVFSDLGPSLRSSEKLAEADFSETISDIFTVKGCQE